MAEITDLTTIDANNTGRWPEGMTFEKVNDGGRADEGIMARWYQDIAGTLIASGSSNAYSVTANRTLAAYIDKQIFAFTANFTNTGAATLAVSGLAAIAIVHADGSALLPGEISNGQVVVVVYVAATNKFQLLSVPTAPAPVQLAVGSVMAWPTENIPSGFLECTGQAVSRTTFAALFAAIGVRYGSGDGSTTFNVPDYRGYFLRGQDHGAGRDPDAGSRGARADGTAGDNPGTTQTHQVGPHNHSGSANVTDPGHTHNFPNVMQNIDSIGQTGMAGSGGTLVWFNGGSAPTIGTATTGISVGITINTTTTTETRPININVRWVIVATPAAVISTFISGPQTILLSSPAVNMNSVADTQFAVPLPPGFTRYRIQALHIKHASTDLTAATAVQFGLFTAAAGGGTAAVAITTATVSSTAENTLNNAQFLAAISATFNVSTLFFRVTTAHGSAATADVEIQIQPLL